MKILKYILTNGKEYISKRTRFFIYELYVQSVRKLKVVSNVDFARHSQITPKVFNTIEDANNYKAALLATCSYPSIILTLKTLEPKEYDPSGIKFIDTSNEFHIETKSQKFFNRGLSSVYLPSCAKCGIQLDNIPFGVIKHKEYKGHDFRISQKLCIFCIKEIAELVETTYQNMDPEWRKEIEAERFIHRL